MRSKLNTLIGQRVYQLDPTPRPSKAPRDGSTPEEVVCVNLSYTLYLLDFMLATTPEQRKQAWIDYCTNYNECYGE